MIFSRIVFVCIIFSALINSVVGQDKMAMETHRMHEMKTWQEMVERGQDHTNDSTIDVKFYHLDIEIAIDSSYISGAVSIRFEPAADGLDELFLDLNEALVVTDISSPCESFYQADEKIWISLDRIYNPDELIDLLITYEGSPIMPGGYKGLRYETHNGDEPIIATLSTPYLAHFWYPCKDGPEDKADSVYIDVTIEKRKVNGLDLIAVSNGILEDTVNLGSKKKFKWRHRYPIVTYYVMAAISNYTTIQDEFDDNGLSFPLNYYVFEEELASQQQGVANLPEAISFFNETFGSYPFANEQFGMTQLGYYGAIENQTNVIQNTMRPSWFMISVHELAHMWFGDMITCETWNHGWLNEGFATYAEALWVEETEGLPAYHTYLNNLQYFGPGTLYLQDIDDPFEIFIPIIYDKGAWALHMLRGVTGDSLFFQALKDYALDANFMYAYANTEQLQETFENTTGMDLNYFFEQWVYDSFYPIYAYNFVQEQDGRLFIAIYQAQEEFYNWRPVFEMPVPVRVSFSDGSDTTLILPNDEQTQQFIFDLDSEVEDVQIDPEKWILRETYWWEELPVGIGEPAIRQAVIVYPNPASDKLAIEVVESGIFPERVEFFNVRGQMVKTVDISAGNSNIRISDIKPGLYFYRIQCKNSKNITGKFIKE